MYKTLLYLLLLPLIFSNLSAADKDKYAMFPKAKPGYTGYIVDLPETENDDDHKVELLIGKNMLVDCNGASFSAKIKSTALRGWGYSYLEVSDIKKNPTTMMACKKQKVARFVSVFDPKHTLQRYNSRLGMVIYVPDGYAVRYRIWSAAPTVKAAIQR